MRTGVSLGRTLTLLAAALSILFVFAVPLGEAPDEGAHLYYLERAVLGAELPRFAPLEEWLSYEAHQPPLDYLVVATTARAIGALPVGYPFVANPALDFGTPGSRALLEREPPREAVRRFRLVRLVRSLWLLPTAIMLFVTARAVGRDDVLLSTTALAAVVFSPQLLFVSATVNNDGGVTFFCSACFLLLLKLTSSEIPSIRVAGWAGTAAALAILSKGTGLALILPVGAAAAWAWRRTRRPAIAVALLFPVAGGLVGLLGLNVIRFGSLWFEFPPVPGYEPSSALRRLIVEPEWIVTLGTSFWARFGWFNLPLPVPGYLLFLPASALALVGVGTAIWGARESAADIRAARLAVLLLAANSAIVVAFMALVAWQPQGRLLLPSIGAICALVAVGLRRTLSGVAEPRNSTLSSALLALMLVSGLAANGFSLYWILRAYQ